MSSPTIHFLGGTDTVTGSKFLLELDHERVLIDCGMFQGTESVERLNRDEPVVDPATLDAIILTHGHLDHVGALPIYQREGFRGPVYGTAPTLATAEIILRDSAKIQEMEAHNQSKERPDDDPVEPLYTAEDALRVIKQFQQRTERQWHDVTDRISYRHRRAGHILGATFLEVRAGDRSLTFSGDLGRSTNPLLPAPEPPRSTVVLVMESTYGNRNHVPYDQQELVARHIRRTIDRRGTVLIPSFAVERTQHVMWMLYRLRESGDIPDVPMYVDTPMGLDVCGLMYDFPEWHRLHLKQWRDVFDRFIPIEDGKKSRAVVDAREPKIVIAGSGMVSGGRILSYLEKHLTDPDSTLMLVGFQAEGTRGRALQEGAEVLRFHSTNVPVQINVTTIPGLSAHADQGELMDWWNQMEDKPDQTFLVHGDHSSRNALQQALASEHANGSITPVQHESVQV